MAERIEEHHLAVVAQESNHPLYSPGEEVPLHKQDILPNLVKECEENISEKEREQLFRLLLKLLKLPTYLLTEMMS